MKTKGLVSAAVITAVLIVALLTQISLLDAANLIINIRADFLVLIFALYLVNYVLRSVRFRVLLGSELGVSKLFNVVCMHNMLNALLPARTGEVSYVYMLRKKHNVSTGHAIASLAVARIFDSISMCVLFFCAFILASGLPELMISVASAMFVVFVIAILVLVGLLFFSKKFVAMMERIFGRHSGIKPVGYLLRKANEASDSVEKIKSKKAMFLTFIISLPLWLSLYMTTYLIINGMGISLGLWDIVLASTIVLMFTSILPIHGVGGFGTHEGTWTIAYMILGLQKELAISSGFGAHIIGLLFTLIFGAYGTFVSRRN